MDIEGKDDKGYVWIQDLRYDDYYYLKDFEHLVVTKGLDLSENPPKECWEALVFEDEKCERVLGREKCKTKEEAEECLERILEISLKNHPEPGS